MDVSKVEQEISTKEARNDQAKVLDFQENI